MALLRLERGIELEVVVPGVVVGVVVVELRQSIVGVLAVA